jgi:hypothetical protein
MSVYLETQERDNCSPQRYGEVVQPSFGRQIFQVGSTGKRVNSALGYEMNSIDLKIFDKNCIGQISLIGYHVHSFTRFTKVHNFLSFLQSLFINLLRVSLISILNYILTISFLFYIKFYSHKVRTNITF